MLEESGLRAEILPELKWTEHIERSLQMLEAGRAPDFVAGVLLHETHPSGVQSIAERLKFSRAETDHMAALVENLPEFSRVRGMSQMRLKRFFRLWRFEDHLELARIHATAAGEDLENYRYAARKRQEWTRNDIWPPPLITGDDLIAMGFTPGPQFKEILTRVEDEQLEGRLESRSDAMEFVCTHFGGKPA